MTQYEFPAHIVEAIKIAKATVEAQAHLLIAMDRDFGTESQDSILKSIGVIHALNELLGINSVFALSPVPVPESEYGEQP